MRNLPVARTSVADRVAILALLAVYAVFAVATIRANVDLAEGRFGLFMDERITFDGVKEILHPSSWSALVYAIADGGDHRYGRILWNVMAAVAFVPERIWGDAGQIVAGRLLQAFVLAATAATLSFGLIRDMRLRVLLSIVILTLPFADYFASMPKPEPLQLLFIAIFCVLFTRDRIGFGWYWIFMGLAFGAKVSTLPPLLIFVATALVVELRRRGMQFAESRLRSGLRWLVLGLALAVPILMPAAIMIIAGDLLGERLGIWRRVGNARFVAMLAGLLAIAWICRRALGTWIEFTFQNTGHGADQASINALSWIHYLLHKWLIAPPWLAAALCAVVLAAFVGAALELRRLLRSTDPEARVDRIIAFAIALAGASLVAAIMVGTKRLFGFYLYPGAVLIATGLTMLVDRGLASSPTNSAAGSRFQTRLAATTALALAAIATVYWAPRSLANLGNLANRTQDPEYRARYTAYRSTISFLDSFAAGRAGGSSPLTVMHDPYLFPPTSTSRYRIVEFWGPYDQWERPLDQAPEVIVLTAVHTPRGSPTPADSPEYPRYVKEQRGYTERVIDKGGACTASYCYERAEVLPQGGEILVLKRP